MALCAPHPTRVEDLLRLEGADLVMPELMATSSQVLQYAAMPDDFPTSVLTSHSPSMPPVVKSLTVASVASTPPSETHSRVGLGTLSKEVL